VSFPLADSVVANTIIAGQKGTYHHLSARVAALLAESGLNKSKPLNVLVASTVDTNRPILSHLWIMVADRSAHRRST
jgi:hypothetical protein